MHSFENCEMIVSTSKWTNVMEKDCYDIFCDSSFLIEICFKVLLISSYNIECEFTKFSFCKGLSLMLFVLESFQRILNALDGYCCQCV